LMAQNGETEEPEALASDKTELPETASVEKNEENAN